ncbi:MAG: phosphoribosylglycinamide formyltransferase [Boseongicola sp.]
MTRVAILISGGGSNMVALAKDMCGDHPARAALVLSDNPGATGLRRAFELGVPTCVVDHHGFEGDRNAFEKSIDQQLSSAETDLICLAGFMRILTKGFVERWHGRLLNIHPSLLPKYPGLDTHARAIAAGDREAGCTVHEVTAELDNGPILGQARVLVSPYDTKVTLAARVLSMEHQLYPTVLRRFVLGICEPVYLSAVSSPPMKAGLANSRTTTPT